MSIFNLFSTMNTYLTPYGSATNGEELLTEFNQRAGLNILGYKEVLDESGFSYISCMTGTKTELDLKISISGSFLKIDPGEFLISGWYGHLKQELTIPLSSILPTSTVPQNVADDWESKVRISLVLSMTGSTDNEHDVRLIPPLNNIYSCLAVVSHSAAPTDSTVGSADRYLYLGDISIDANRRYHAYPNSQRTRLISMDKIQGAENFGRWVQVFDDTPTDTIFAIMRGQPNNLIPISNQVWLNRNSPLGRFLQNLTTLPDEGGYYPGSHSVPYGLIVGELTATESTDDGSTNRMIRLVDKQSAPKLTYRFLRSGVGDPNEFSEESIPLPFAAYRESPGSSNMYQPGIIRGETLLKIDTLYSIINPEAGGTWHGTQYGPFNTTAEMQSYFSSPAIKSRLREGDYCWVLNDTVDEVVDGASQEIVTNFGEVSGTGSLALSGMVPVNVASMGVNVLVDTESNPQFTLNNGTLRVSETTGTAESVQISIPSGQEITLDVESANLTAPNFSGRLSASSVPMTSDDVTLQYDEPVPGSDPPETETVTIENVHGSGSFAGSGTFSGSLSGQTAETTTKAKTKRVSVSGTPNLTNATVTFGSGTLEGTFNATGIVGTGTGSGTGTINASLDNVRITGKLDRFSQNVSSCWVYLVSRNLDGEPIVDGQGNLVYEWKRQCVLRGYSTPATANTYGFVRTGTGSLVGDVVLDPVTQRLKLRDEDIAAISVAGWKIYNSEEDTLITVSPDTIGQATAKALEGTYFSSPVTIKLIGNWTGQEEIIFKRMRGDITVDLSDVYNPTALDDQGQPIANGEKVPLTTFEDVNFIQILNKNENTGASSDATINVVDSVVDYRNFNSIYRWINSVFRNGSNTCYPENAWILIKNPFSSSYSNTVECRIASFTRGEYGVVGAELDLRVNRGDNEWTASEIESGKISMVSIDSLKFPPFVLQVDSSGNIKTRQDIPTSLNLKVSGSAGTNRNWDQVTDTYPETGNLVVNIDWENGRQLSIKGLLNAATGNCLRDMRVRLPIMVNGSQEMIVDEVDYNRVYHD